MSPERAQELTEFNQGYNDKNKQIKDITESQLVGKVSPKMRSFILKNNNGVHLHSNVGLLLSKHDMTQQDLVKLTGIPQNQMSAFATNRQGVKMGYHHLLAIAEAFGITDLSEILEIRRKL